MKRLQYADFLVADEEGILHSIRERGCIGGQVEIRESDLDEGYVCRVTARREGGLNPDQAVVLRFSCASVQFFAIEAHSSFWCRPAWGDTLADLPARVQMLVFRREDKFVCVLPLCGDTFKTLIRGWDGGFECYSYANVSGLTDCTDQPAFLCTEADRPFDAIRAAARQAGAAMGRTVPLREERTLAPVFSTLGWCSWDAFQIRVNHEGLLEKAAEFREKGVPVGFAIIDDMWADAPHLNEIPEDASFHDMVHEMHRSTLNAFEGDPKRFPRGMQAAVEDLKAAGIPKVGIWFPVTGYWSGFTPNETGAKELEEVLTTAPNGQLLPDPHKAEEYFDALCGKVKAWGGDFVKIDNQGCQNRYAEVCPIGESARKIHAAIDSACEKHFDGALINCMGMPSECTYSRPKSAVSRCSDDFIPESREWFSKNILQCSFNGLLQGQFYVNDWDMWWTDDEQAVKNSLCRAISGGPIYVSDKLGRTNPEILKPLALSDGNILPCDESATPTEDCLFENPVTSGKIYKIRNRMGDAGLVAAFHLNRENVPLQGKISPADGGVTEDCAYYEFFTGEAGILKAGESIDLTLKNNDDFRLYTFVPLTDGIACTGRSDLMMGVGAVTRKENDFTLKEAGPVLFAATVPATVTLDGVSYELSEGITQICTEK